MCGILFLKDFNADKIGKKALKRYNRQKERGSEGFGLVAVDNAEVTDYKRFQLEDTTLKALKNLKATSLLFHHRFPTSTANVAECSHPIRVSHAELPFILYLAHNGIIYNDEELKKKHNDLGYKYETEITEQTTLTTKGNTYTLGKAITKWNDSEALAVDVARFLAGKQENLEARGSIAFIGLMVSKDNKQVLKLVYGRNNGSPLVLEKRDNGGLVLASVGNGEEVVPDQLNVIDWKTGHHSTFTIASIATAEKRAVGFSASSGWGWNDYKTSKDKNTCGSWNDEEVDDHTLYEQTIYEIEALEEEEVTYREYKMFDEAVACRRRIGQLEKQLDQMYLNYE